MSAGSPHQSPSLNEARSVWAERSREGSFTLLWGYASRKELIEEGLTSLTVGIQAARFLASPIVFVLSMIIAMVDPSMAILSWLLLLPINSILESRLVASLENSLGESATPPP
ncbi:hypothetical protein [Halococcus morrhuae]|uniref:hypothetical protein n=1 Tax=Halococcus morrhuae TaxID=2250 RepID=UPI0018729493|nr:hypothetical protein [Halococcus morrhuae]